MTPFDPMPALSPMDPVWLMDPVMKLEEVRRATAEDAEDAQVQS
jgi:hypothetical protein